MYDLPIYIIKNSRDKCLPTLHFDDIHIKTSVIPKVINKAMGKHTWSCDSHPTQKTPSLRRPQESMTRGGIPRYQYQICVFLDIDIDI